MAKLVDCRCAFQFGRSKVWRPKPHGLRDEEIEGIREHYDRFLNGKAEDASISFPMLAVQEHEIDLRHNCRVERKAVAQRIQFLKGPVVTFGIVGYLQPHTAEIASAPRTIDVHKGGSNRIQRLGAGFAARNCIDRPNHG